MLWIGRITIWVAMLVSVAFAWSDALGIGGEGGFTYIQKYTGYISPGIFAVFILGFFWKRTTGAAAIAGVLGGFALVVFFNHFATSIFGQETWLYTAFPDGNGNFVIPFLVSMGISFFMTVALMIAISLAGPKINPKGLEIDAGMFRLSPTSLTMIVVILMLFSMLYIRFW